MLRLIACGIVLASLVGCASPSYVGKWSAENLPPDIRSVTLEMNADGTFNGVTEADQPTHFAGTWKKDGSGKAVMTQHGEEKPGTATLIGKDRMVVDVAEEPSLQFKRARDAR